MLEKARARVERQGLDNVDGLHEMDAGALAFPDESFDTVVAMYVMTVVPDPEKVMRELERVCATGGEVILVNHFSQEEGVRGFVERRLAPLATSIGWHAVFTLDHVMICEDLDWPSGGRSGPSACSPCSASSRSRAWGWWHARFVAPVDCAGKSAGAGQARLPEPVRVKIKWQIARTLVVGRVCLTPVIGAPYIDDFPAKWRSSSAG